MRKEKKSHEKNLLRRNFTYYSGTWYLGVSEYLARNSKESLSYLEIESERKKVPEFDFTNQK